MPISDKIRNSVALLTGMVTEDSSSGGSEIVKSTNQSLNTYSTALISGENQPLDILETANPGTYVSAVGVTTATDIVLGNPGGAGNKIVALMVFNNSGSAFTACTLKDGTTTLTFLTLGMTTLASGSYATWTPPGGALESKNGAWRINITCAGTMANIAIGAVILEG